MQPWTAHVLEVVYRFCVAAGGAPNIEKLKVFRLRRVDGCLRLLRGSVQTLWGNLPASQKGLSFVGIPLRQGDRPVRVYSGAIRAATLLLASVLTLRPTFTLALRCSQPSQGIFDG